MTPKAAEKIINQYGAVFTRGAYLRRPLAWLPCSKARVKYAFFVWVETLIEQDALTQDLGEKIDISYGLLSTFVDDGEAERVNELSKLSERNELDWTSEEATLLKNALTVEATSTLSGEINDFIGECYERRRGKP